LDEFQERRDSEVEDGTEIKSIEKDDLADLLIQKD